VYGIAVARRTAQDDAGDQVDRGIRSSDRRLYSDATFLATVHYMRNWYCGAGRLAGQTKLRFVRCLQGCFQFQGRASLGFGGSKPLRHIWKPANPEWNLDLASGTLETDNDNDKHLEQIDLSLPLRYRLAYSLVVLVFTGKLRILVASHCHHHDIPGKAVLNRTIPSNTPIRAPPFPFLASRANQGATPYN
jgi:hypothetical protein